MKVPMALLAGCYGMRVQNDIGNTDNVLRAADGAATAVGTLPYESRFGSDFSLADAEADIYRQMCEVYLAPVSAGQLQWSANTCQNWVAEHVAVEDGPLITVSAGDPSKPLVIFVHGWPDNPAIWVNQFMVLSRDYRCVAVQLPNYLDALPTEELYIDEVVDRVGEVLAGRQAYLVAHDWGANFGYMIAYKFPNLILKYAALDIGNDVQMWLDAQNPSITSPMATFIRFYQTRLAAAYRDPGFVNDATVATFALTGGSPGGHATPRMGMYYDRVWNREEFQRRLAPDVPLDEWQCLWTPLGGTGITQRGMLYIQGSNLATTPLFLDAVRADGGRVVEMMDGGHWIPMGAAAKVSAELGAWLEMGVHDYGEGNVQEYPVVFSLPEVQQQLKTQMCGEYWVQEAHPIGTDCRSEVQQKITIDHDSMVTARAGDPANQMIVFIHGWPDTAALWVNQLLRFSRMYYCVAVQLPNYLDALPTEELYIDEVVARIGAVIGDRETLLVGHDWGANLGYMVAYKFPDNVLRYAALDIGNDLQMWLDVAPETRSNDPMSLFITYYQTQLGAAYRNCLTGQFIVDVFARTGGSPGGHATCRMGMLYDRAWSRDEFQQRMAPDVPVADWLSLWTPLGGTGIPQSGMLYIQGSNLATTDKFLDAVRADDGTVVQLLNGEAGHWLPVQGTEHVNPALERWFAGSGADILDIIPYDTLSFTGCSALVVQDIYSQGFRFTETRMSLGKQSLYVRCAGDMSEEPSINKISCKQERCGGHAWCFVENDCRNGNFAVYNRCSALSNQNPLNCVQLQ